MTPFSERKFKGNTVRTVQEYAVQHLQDIDRLNPMIGETLAFMKEYSVALQSEREDVWDTHSRLIVEIIYEKYEDEEERTDAVYKVVKRLGELGRAELGRDGL